MRLHSSGYGSKSVTDPQKKCPFNETVMVYTSLVVSEVQAIILSVSLQIWMASCLCPISVVDLHTVEPDVQFVDVVLVSP